MTLDITGPLGALLDGMLAQGGGRKQRFQYIPWGKHQDQKTYNALPVAAPPTTTVRDSLLSIREVTNPTRESDVGGGAQQNRQMVDVNVWWQDDADVTDPDAFRVAVVDAIKTIVRANRRNCPPAYYITIRNSLKADFLQADRGTASLFRHHIVTVEARGVEVYS